MKLHVPAFTIEFDRVDFEHEVADEIARRMADKVWDGFMRNGEFDDLYEQCRRGVRKRLEEVVAEMRRGGGDGRG